MEIFADPQKGQTVGATTGTGNASDAFARSPLDVVRVGCGGKLK